MERESARIRQETERSLKSPYGSPVPAAASGGNKKRTNGVAAVTSPYRAGSPAAFGTAGAMTYGSALSALQAVQLPSESDSSGLSPDHLNNQLFKLNTALSKAKKEKFTMSNELKIVQQGLTHSRLEIKNLEQQIKQNRAKAEDVRTELMLAEFKRDSARKELEKVLADVSARRHQLRELDEEEQQEEVKKAGQHQQQLHAAMAEREELVGRIKSLESQLGTLEARERERSEIERQLSTTKEELFAEQKRARTHMDTIKEEMSSQNTRISDLQKERDRVKKELEVKAGRIEELLTEKNKMQGMYEKLENKYKQMEADKNTIIKEKSEEYEELRTRTQEQMVQSRSNNSQESTQLRQQLHDVTDRLAGMNTELNRKEELNLQLREQVLEIQQQIAEEREKNKSLTNEHQSSMNNVHNQTDAAVKQAQFEAEQDKQQALEALRQELNQQSQQQLRQIEARLKTQIGDLQAQTGAKDVEIDALIDKVKQQELHAKQYSEQLRQESQDRLLECLRDERNAWEHNKDAETRHLLANMRDELERTSAKLRQDLEYERDLVDKQKRQLSSLQTELEETREQNRQSYREKLDALDKMKETAELEKEREVDFVKEKLEKETSRSLERLRDTISRQEEELTNLRAERHEHARTSQESTAHTEQTQRAVVKDLNEECRRLATVLGIMPRKASLSMYNGWSPGTKGSSQHTQNALTSAMQNLRTTGDDVGKLVAQLRREVETNKDAVMRADRGKSEELEALKHKLHTEKIQALESLKDRLIKVPGSSRTRLLQEHLEEVDKLHKSFGKDKNSHKALRDKDHEIREIQRNMGTWKTQQTEKIGRKFQEEMQRELEKRTKDHKSKQRDWEREKMSQQRELERLEREVQHTRMNSSLYNRPSSPSPNRYGTSTPVPDSPSQSQVAASGAQLRQVQAQVKQLQLENTMLRRSKTLSASSVPDLSMLNSSFSEKSPLIEGRKTAHLDAQIQQFETKARLAEDRAKKNDQLLNQKMLEMSKLQSTLTQQTKELMQLERAYSQLQQKTSTASPRVSFAR